MLPNDRNMNAAPCQAACPAGVDVPSYVALIGQGRCREAIELILEDNPFPWVCGLVCPHPCEQACVRNSIDRHIAIKALKAFAAACVDRMDDEQIYRPPAQRLEKVAVVGAGPAGLTAAYFLAKKGYEVTVFEALPVAGGMLSVGIPEYRLLREVIRKEVERIERMGVTILTNSPIGGDYTIPKLREEGYKAFFVGIGAHRGLRLSIPGETDYPQVWDAVTFLNRHFLGENVKAGDKVAVIGGGNAAIDAARISLRLGSREVDILYRRTRREMPALPEEIVEAEEEGVRFHYLTIPVKILGQGVEVTGVECVKAELGEPDRSGRRRPVPIEGSEFVLEADAVIATIGQSPDIEWIGEEYSLDTTRWRTIVVNPHSMQTSTPDVFAGGDVVTGPSMVIEAIAAGKRAARGIDAYLRGKPMPNEAVLPRPRMRVAFDRMEAAQKFETKPFEADMLSPAVRKRSFDQVVLDMDEETARREAGRCLRCDACIGCGDCADVCRNQMGVGAITCEPVSAERKVMCDLTKTAERCIGGGCCTHVCPQGVLKTVDEGGERRLEWCGVVLSRSPLARCERCGTSYAPLKVLEYIGKKADTEPELKVNRTLCPDCAREAKAIAMAASSHVFHAVS